MGCTQTGQQIITPSTNPPVPLRTTLYSTVKTLVEEFESGVLEKITATKPLSILEFNKLIKSSLENSLKSFETLTIALQSQKQFHSQLIIFKNFLISKCKSKEGLFRNLNDINSQQHIAFLRRTLIAQLQKGTISEQQCLETFSKFAKGTFVLRGLSDIHQMLTLSEMEREKYLEQQEKVEKNELEEDRLRLVSACNKGVAWANEEIVNGGNLNLGFTSDSCADLLCEDLDPMRMQMNAFKFYNTNQ